MQVKCMYVSMWLNDVEMGWSNVGKGVFDGQGEEKGSLVVTWRSMCVSGSKFKSSYGLFSDFKTQISYHTLMKLLNY